MVHLDDGARPPALGEKVRYRPMHVCPVVNLTDTLIGTRDGVVEEVFEVAARGRTW
jgi:D-serine deaminase-like pyridoxal phosphate-dependent protein